MSLSDLSQTPCKGQSHPRGSWALGKGRHGTSLQTGQGGALGQSQTAQAQQGRAGGKSSCSHSRHWQHKAGMAEPPWEGKEGDVVCPDFSQAWDMLCCALLRARLERAGLQEWNMGWVGIWLNNQGQMSSMAQSPLGSHCLGTSLSDQPLSTTVEHFYDLYSGMKCIFNSFVDAAELQGVCGQTHLVNGDCKI